MKDISKIVVSKENGQNLGYVLDYFFVDAFIVSGYIVVEEESENEYFLKKSDAKVTDEFLFVESVTLLQFLTDRETSLVGKMLLTNDGKNLGVIKGFDIKKNRCHRVWTDLCEMPASKIAKVGKDFVFVGKKKQTNFSKVETFKTDVDSIVSIQKIEEVKVPEKLVLSAEHFLGKVAREDVFGYNNERVIAKGEKVTKAIVEKAKLHNRLNQLYFATKN